MSGHRQRVVYQCLRFKDTIWSLESYVQVQGNNGLYIVWTLYNKTGDSALREINCLIGQVSYIGIHLCLNLPEFHYQTSHAKLRLSDTFWSSTSWPEGFVSYSSPSWMAKKMDRSTRASYGLSRPTRAARIRYNCALSLNMPVAPPPVAEFSDTSSAR